jgi:hypothetical protein
MEQNHAQRVIALSAWNHDETMGIALGQNICTKIAKSVCHNDISWL